MKKQERATDDEFAEAVLLERMQASAAQEETLPAKRISNVSGVRLKPATLSGWNDLVDLSILEPLKQAAVS